MKREDVIGKVAYGVAISKRSVYYTSLTDEYIGKKGVITDKKNGYFLIKFAGISIQYPIKRLEEAIKLAETKSSEPTSVSNPDSSFPEKWCLKVNEDNLRMISDWRSAGQIRDSLGGYVMYEGYSFKGVRGYYELTKPKSCTEITTEQFREHVLKETSKVVVEPTEFKKGNYIVLLEDTLGNFLKNHCVKQSKNCSHLHAELTCCGIKNDGSLNTKFDQSGYKWRYATPEEAAKYNSIGKPYDVTTLVSKPAIKKWSVGSYVVFCEKIWKYNIGDIDVIIEAPFKGYANMALRKDSCVATSREKEGTFKWFATREEAEEFAKTLTKEVVEEKVKEKFIVGQWYKSNLDGNKYYLKYDRTMPSGSYNLIYYSTFIKNQIFKTNNYIAHTELEKSLTLLTDLSEIQQYLPDGHPDKALCKKVMTKEELLAYAKEHYPIGTEFNNTNLYPNQTICNSVVSENTHEWCGSIIDVSTNFSRQTLYKDGKWAEIKSVAMTEKELLEEAKRKYPIGTIFSNSNLGCGCDGIKVTGEGFYKDKWADIVIDNLSNASQGRYTVYKDGEWAKVTTPASSLSQLIATKHWGPELVGKSFISDVDDLDGSYCLKGKTYIIHSINNVVLNFRLDDRGYIFSIHKNSFLKHCKLVPDSTAKVADDPKNITIPEIQQTKSTVNYTVSTALTELTVNIPNGKKTKQVPVITVELSQINCNV
jgi:hypothetical protein